MNAATKGRNLRLLVALVVVSMFVGVSAVRADEPVDFGFETGDLTGWTVISSPVYVGVQGANSYTSPYWGSYMVVLGSPTGTQYPGDNTVSASFTVISPTIIFAYNAFTFDYTGWDHYGYTVRLAGSDTVLAQLNAMAWGSSASLKTSGWQVVTVDTSSYLGQRIEVRFSAGGTGDYSYATWAYFDGKPAAFVPSPPMVDFLNSVVTSTSPVTMVPVTVRPGSCPGTTLTLSVNGIVLASSGSQGTFNVPINVNDGEYTLNGLVVDNVGLSDTASTHLIVDTHAPTVDVAGAGAAVHTPTVNVDGVATDAVSGVGSVAVNGTPVDVFVDGSFSSAVSLKKGANTVDVEAVDKLGNSSVSSWTYTYQPAVAVRPYSVTMVLNKKDVCIDGSWETGTASPMIYKGKVYLPAAAVLKLAGGTFSYASGQATIGLGGRTCTVGLGGNGGTVMGGVYYLPLEYLRDVVGIDLAWEPVSQTISFTRWP